MILVLLSVTALFIVVNNKQILYSNLAKYYVSKNNEAKAVEYYEKAFNEGYQDYDARKLYVELLKKSDFSVDVQKRLLKISEGEINDIAKYEAESFLFKKMQELHNLYPLNYIKQAPYNQKIIRWGNFPVTYCFKNSDIFDYKNEIRHAFEEWERSAKTGLKFKEVDFEDANIVIEFVNNKTIKNVEEGQKYIIAYTTPEIINNDLKKMEIKFYVYAPKGEKFTNEQIYNTALHEIFHALGFTGHSYDKNNIMYMSNNPLNFDKNTRKQLTEADISTLNLLYSIVPDISNVKVASGKYLPIIAIGDSDDVNYAKEKEAKNYINHAPSLPNGYIDLAQSFVEKKQYAKAIKSLDKALTLCDSEETKYIVLYNLAVSYFYIGNYDMALDYISYAEKIKNSEEIHYLKSQIYLKQNDTKSAIAEFEKLCAIAPKNIDYATGLANIYIEKHNYLKARKVIKNYIENNPQEKNNKKLGIYRY